MLVNRPRVSKSLSVLLSALSASVAMVQGVVWAQTAQNTLPQAPQITAQPPMVATQQGDATPVYAALNPAQTQAMPDTDALRYYAIRGEQNRMQAEMKRLKTLYPHWTPPRNIFAEQGSEEQELWDLFADKKYEKVRLEIERKNRLDHNFTASDDLLNKLDQQERRDKIAKAWAKQNWGAVIELADASPDLLISDDIELIWFVGEAYAQKERPKDAYVAFEAALNSAKTPKERAATVEKAALSLSSNESLRLLETARQLPDGEVLSGTVQDSIIRGALARAAHIGEQPPTTLTAQIEAFENRTEALGNAADSVLIAWSKFGQRDWQAAEGWFARALSTEPTAKAVEGAILTAIRLKKTERAAALSSQWLGHSDEIDALFVNVHASRLLEEKPKRIDGDFLHVYAEKTVALNSGEGAEALGWYAYNLKEYDVSGAWFSKAMEWEQTETATYGKMLIAQITKDRIGFEGLQQAYAHRYASVAALKFTTKPKRSKQTVSQRRSPRIDKANGLRNKIARIYKTKQFSKCLELSRQLRRYGPLSGQDQQMRGWCLLGAKRPVEAQDAFAAATRLGGKGKNTSAYGQVLAALRSGQTNQALSIANAYSLTAKQRRVVDIELLTQRARAAFANKDYAASVYALDQRQKMTTESRNLSFMRGWAHYHSGDYDHARNIFAVLDQQLSTHETRRGMSAVQMKITRRLSHER